MGKQIAFRQPSQTDKPNLNCEHEWKEVLLISVPKKAREDLALELSGEWEEINQMQKQTPRNFSFK